MWYTFLTLLAPLGWYGLLKNRRIAPSHIPLLVCCLHMLVLYAAAFAGLLHEASALLTFTGCGLLLWLLCTRRLRPSAPTPGLIVFLAGTVWAVLSTMDTVCYSWDDMSHWMRCVKALAADGRYPSQLTRPEISYVSYPPGSALFISHWLAHLPQRHLSGRAVCALHMLELACASAALSPLEKLPCRKPAVTAAALLGCGLFFRFLPYSDTVMPDLLLGLFAAAFFGICLHAGRERTSLGVLLPVAACLCLIKNSALLLLAFAVVFYLVWEQRKPTADKRCLLRAAVLALGALAVFAGWTLYSRIAFPDLESSSQALSLARYAGILSSHAPGFYPRLAGVFCKRLLPDLSVMTVFWLALAGAGWALLPAARRLTGPDKTRLTTPALLMLCFDAVYLLALLFSYAFTFTEREALETASFERYFVAFLVSHAAVFGCLTAEAVCTLPQPRKRKRLLIMAGAGAALLIALQAVPYLTTADSSREERVLSTPNDWYIRQLCTAAEDLTAAQTDKQYVLWLYDRTGEPPVVESYKISMYTRIAAAARFCLPDNNARTLDLAVDKPKDIAFVLRSFTDRENAVVVLTDTRPEALEAALQLNIPILYGSGIRLPAAQ
jgi:hypothetical protein